MTNNQPRRITVKALTKAFNKDGADGVKQLMALKPKSGPTLQKTIEELAQSGKNVTDLQAFYDVNYIIEEKEYIETYDRGLYGDKDEIAQGVADFNPAKVYQAIRQYDIQPALYKRTPGARGKGTNIFLRTDVLEAISKFREEKSAEYMAEKPENMVTPADMLAMFPDSWGITNTSYCGGFVKFWGIVEHAKYRVPGAKGKGAALYSRTDVQATINIIIDVRKVRSGEAYESDDDCPMLGVAASYFVDMVADLEEV